MVSEGATSWMKVVFYAHDGNAWSLMITNAIVFY